MIRMGRYDVFDKWEIVCRSWAGEVIDVGTDRYGDPLLPAWQLAAFGGGSSSCHDYIRLQCEVLNPGARNAEVVDDGESGELNPELSLLLREIGYDELLARTIRLIEAIKSPGSSAGPAFAELPPRVSDRLTEIFRSGALLALRWTDDRGEIPDIEVMRSKIHEISHLREQGVEFWRGQSIFPRDAIKGKRNVLSMFCARFYGLMDVINIYGIEPDQVTLVDRDAECIEAMRQIYPREWNYVASDYEDFLRHAEEHRLRYDLIVTDPWAGQCKEVGLDGLPRIMDLCTDLYVTHYTQKMCDELGVALEDLDGLSRAIAQRTGVDVAVTATLRRSYLNGWVVMRRRVAPQIEAIIGFTSTGGA
jgi:hypothetical protein